MTLRSDVLYVGQVAAAGSTTVLFTVAAGFRALVKEISGFHYTTTSAINWVYRVGSTDYVIGSSPGTLNTAFVIPRWLMISAGDKFGIYCGAGATDVVVSGALLAI